MQTLHLMAVDVDRRAALAVTYGSRWLLPVVTCHERTRALPLVTRWLRERGISGDVAGQWLGRVTDDAIDWLLPIPTQLACASTVALLEWHELNALASSASVLEYQQWALSRTLVHGRQPCINGPFGNLSWPHEVRRWIGGAMESSIAKLTPYRAGAHEVVVEAESAERRVYFKGLTQERGSEAQITRALAAIEPDSFAPTIAFGPGPDDSAWWLTGACRGRPCGNAHRVAQALARIQQRLATTDVTRELSGLDLDAAIEWASRLLGVSPPGLRANAPDSWIPMDLDPTNALVDSDGGVRFIDLDDSFVGAAPLAIAGLARRCGDRSLQQTYEQSWSPALTGLDWAAFETMATVVQSWLAWRRLERSVARGEVFVDRELAAARTRVRLVKALG